MGPSSGYAQFFAASAYIVPLAIIVLFVVWGSIRRIGPTEVGLVTKRWGLKKLPDDNPLAFRGEAGYQAELMMPGLRWKFWPIFRVDKHPWVQVPAGEIGVVIAQVGEATAIGAKSAVYKSVFGNFSDLDVFIKNGGQKGIQRPVLQPGTLIPIHPLAFIVITTQRVYGVPVDPGLRAKDNITFADFGLEEKQLKVFVVEPRKSESRSDGGKGVVDTIGIVTTLEGDPLPSGDIAGRLGGFEDLAKLEEGGVPDSRIIDVLLGSKNNLHNNYQDYQAFLSNGGRIGLQHDPLLYGAFTLNPFLVSVEIVPMLVVNQGEAAVIKAYVGRSTEDTSGEDFQFGSLVRPGHRGIWQEPLRTGKYPINPRCYQAEVVPTAILTLNWAEESSKAHELDKELVAIHAMSSEGFDFTIDLQVQIHVPDTQAPKVISMVGTMFNLVNEVLQAAVGNHFRDKLQSMPAVQFIETRQGVQEEAFNHIREQLSQYQVETKGVYIQDVVLPKALVEVLTQREIANQEIATYGKQKQAEDTRIAMENSKGTANMQEQLAKSKVGVDIKINDANARKAEAEGEAAYIQKTGEVQGAAVRSVGMARAEAYREQVKALGQFATALVNVASELKDGNVKIVPDVLVTGGEGGNVLNAVLASLLKRGGEAAVSEIVPAGSAAPSA